ncbi:hypothetical protein FRC12_015769 [Ceratobasidium sp. 428]|nr:hypothetical protein FRC12_015769 [Ceratobasidium sp. 428]
MTQAVALTPDNHPDLSGRLSNLGSTHYALFDRLGKLEHIPLAVNCMTQAVALTPDRHPDLPSRLSNLGNTYEALSDRLGKLEYLHLAVDCKTQAVALTPDGHPDLPVHLNHLGNTYDTLFTRLGELEHIYLAVDCKTRAVALTPDSSPHRPGRLNNLGNTYQTLFHRLGNLEHIHLAIDYRTQAVALTPDGHPDKPACLNNLGSTFSALFDCLGQLEHIHLAVHCMTQAVTLTPNSHPEEPHHLINIGDAFHKLFNCTGEHEHIFMAVDSMKKASVLIPERSPSGAECLFKLGSIYFTLFTTSHEPQHLAESKFYSRCTALSLAGRPMLKLQAAALWTRFSKLDGFDPLEAYSHCMLRLPEVVWLGTSVRRRFEQCLTSYIQDLASDAAAAAIVANRYDLAIEWLEQGRCLVWGQILQLRTPLDSLQASYPELSDELHCLSSQLEEPGVPPQYLQASIMHQGPPRSGSCMQSQLADKRERLIGEIRLKPGFEDFLRPPNASTIISRVRLGATVVLTVHESQRDALIIQPDTHAVSHVPLPHFSHQKAEDLRKELGLCLKSQGIFRGFKKGDRPLQASFKSILAVLWSGVVKPVLDHLNISRVLLIDDLPRITWCITGLLSFLPIHAAGIYDNPSTVLSNLAISSYTPTVSSISRSCTTPPTFSGILAVGHQSSVRGLSPLPGTKDELDRVEAHFANRRFSRLEEDAATIDAVVDAMRDHSWVHFACHGSQNLVDPMNSALHLHDNDLSLAMISKNPMKNAQLAFLSACQTAQGDSELLNEVVHLAAGLLMAGYANVIATMWSIKDQDAPIVAGVFYKCMLEDGVPDSGKAAKALHRAVKHLQDEIGVEEFARWVPYIHMGG